MYIFFFVNKKLIGHAEPEQFDMLKSLDSLHHSYYDDDGEYQGKIHIALMK